MATQSSGVYGEVFQNVHKAADASLKMQREMLDGWTRFFPAFSGIQSAWFDPLRQAQQRWTDSVFELARNQCDALDRQIDVAVESLGATMGVAEKSGAPQSKAEQSRAPEPKGNGNRNPMPQVLKPEEVKHLATVGTKNIAQKVAVVTGAASGIGEAVSRELAHRGAKMVLMVDLSERVQETADGINKEVGRDAAQGIVGDTTDSAFRAQVYDDAVPHGVPSICVPAAGITRDALSVRIDKATGKASVYPVDDFRKVTEVNLIAPIYWAIEMVAKIAEDRRKRGLKRWEPEEGVEGVVVFLGSVSSQGNKGQISYAVAKAGLEGAAATLMKEAIFHGVRCGIIHPGFTDTPMARALGEDFLQKHVLPFTQLRRLIRPEEIADAICFMISNSAVSGELWADAGWHPPA